MAISPVGSPETATSSGTSIAIPVPAGVQEGHLLLAVIASTSTVDPSSGGDIGFQLLAATSLWASRSLEIWWRYAPESPPADYGFELNTAATNTGTMRAYRGVHRTDPFDDNATTTDAAATDTIVLNQVTTTHRNCLLLGVVGGEGTTWTAPGSMTERWDFAEPSGAPVSQAGAEEQLGAEGATGTRSFVASAATAKGGILVAIAPGQTSFVGFVGHRG